MKDMTQKEALKALRAEVGRKAIAFERSNVTLNDWMVVVSFPGARLYSVCRRTLRGAVNDTIRAVRSAKQATR